ncbi:MAG: protein kinase [Pirellulaceae bacterium]|nr:protein kinase [Pirellulaceae bacterium]
MNDELYELDESLSVDAFERVHSACHAFEEIWKNGQRPKIEAFVGEFEGDERKSAFHNLLRVEIYYRRRNGSDPLSSEYCNRFPDFAFFIGAVFRALAEEDDEPLARDKAQAPAGTMDNVPAVVDGPAREERCVECQDCRNKIPLEDPQPQEVTCPNCGSTVEVDPEATIAHPKLPKKIGRYRVLDSLGQGSFGVVYKAYDPELKLTVAIKMARPQSLDTQVRRERFLGDARAAARLNHKNIVRAHDIGHECGVPYIVSDFIDGMTLDEFLSGDRLTFKETAELAAQMADALGYAHGEGVVHRDVKPSNILIDRTGKPYLTDFGLAHRDEEGGHVTLSGELLGTPAYMSPEQAGGESRNADGRSDLFSLGVVLYRLLTGELPFRGRGHMLLSQIQNDEPPPPRRLNDQVPRDLETICLKCLEKEPRNRYPTGQDLHDDLRRYLRREPIQARPIGKTTRAWRWCMRNPLVTSFVVVTTVLLAALIVVLCLYVSAVREAERIVKDIDKTQREIRNTKREIAKARSTEEIMGALTLEQTTDSLPVEVPDLEKLANKKIPWLLEQLQCPFPLVRAGAAEALGEFGRYGKRAIAALENARDDDMEDPEVREAAKEALENIQTDAAIQ